MKRLTILAIIACLGLLFAPAAVIGDPAGPPSGLDVKIVNPIPLPVTGEVDATVTGNVNVTNTPNVNVVNDEAHPIPVTVTPQNGGELVIIREGYMVPEGKMLKIVDMTVGCSIVGPELPVPGTAYLTWNLMATPTLRIRYDDLHCPEPLTGQPPECPSQGYALGLSGNYNGHSLTPDGYPVIPFIAGRQVNITAYPGAILEGICFAGLEEIMGAGITTGQGYLHAISP